jgi:hypothetical protein
VTDSLDDVVTTAVVHARYRRALATLPPRPAKNESSGFFKCSIGESNVVTSTLAAQSIVVRIGRRVLQFDLCDERDESFVTELQSFYDTIHDAQKIPDTACCIWQFLIYHHNQTPRHGTLLKFFTLSNHRSPFLCKWT